MISFCSSAADIDAVPALVRHALGERATDLGVDVQYRREVTDSSTLTDADLVRYGEHLQLDASTMVGEPAQRFVSAIELDYSAGADLGVHGTPTLFLDDQPYTDRVEVGALRSAVTRAGRR